MILDSGLLVPGAALLVVLFVVSRIIGGLVKKLLVNSIVGVIAVGLAAVFFNVEIALTPVSILLILLGGIPGSVLVIGLSALNIAFAGPGMDFIGSGLLTTAIRTLAEVPGQQIVGTAVREIGEKSGFVT